MTQRSLTEPLRSTLAIFEASGPPLTTPEVAEALDLGRRTAYGRLERLVDRGELETKKVGANARVWWRPPRSQPSAVAGEDAGTDGEGAFAQSLLDSQPDLLYAFAPDGTFLRWNDRLPEVTGYDESDIESMHPVDFVADEAAEETLDAMERVLQDGENVVLELPLETADGERIPYEFTGGPLTDETGEIVGFTGIGRDVSDRKARERRLERQQTELQAELDDVFSRIDEAFFALDEDWRFTYVNDRAAEVVRLPVGELVGTRIWDALPELDEGYPRAMAERAMGTQEPVEFEFYSEELEIWVEVRGYPSETGMSVYFRDVTERVERERDLELYETIFETVEDGVYVLDGEFRFQMVNDAYVEMTGYDREELLGEPASLVVSEEVAAESFDRLQEVVAGEAGSAVLEADIHRADGTRLRAESRFTALPAEDGDLRKVGIVRDVSERLARERELGRYERMVETADDGIYVLDEDARFVAVNGALCELTGYDREELLDEHASLVTDDENVETGNRLVEELEAGEQTRTTIEETITTKDGGTVPIENGLARFDFDDGGTGRIGVVRDVSERRERERELRKHIRQQEVVADLGQRALEENDLDALFAEAAETVAETLDNDYCKVLDLDPDAEELLLRQGVGWDDGIVGEATVSSVEDNSQAAYTLATEQPVVVPDLSTEERFSGPELLTSHDVRSGVSTIIGSPEDPWGILGTHDTAPRDISEQDAAFVQSVANVLASAIERHRHERMLRNRREQITALNNVNEVVRGITGAVVDQSTREEIEATVCERFAATDSYRFAWIGDVDPTSQTMSLRAEAGVEGYLDDHTISIDPDDEHGQGPTGRAFRTREIQTSQDARIDQEYGPWQDAAEQYDFRSSAAVPIVHDDAIYGVLNVYADRPRAFEGEEREVIAQLGEIVGHAIAAAERKQALLSDEVVELEFQMEDVFEALGIEANATEPIALDETVLVEENDYLFFGSTTADGVEIVETLVEEVPFYEAVTFRGEGDERRFELQVTDPPVLSVIASLGGSVEEAVIEDGDYRLRVHLPPSAEVRRLTDAMNRTYPNAILLKRRQLTKPRPDVDGTRAVLSEDLTDRQRTALETAHHAGFFDWPREASGEDVAASLGVAPATFHQHLRKAEGKVFDALFARPA